MALDLWRQASLLKTTEEDKFMEVFQAKITELPLSDQGDFLNEVMGHLLEEEMTSGVRSRQLLEYVAKNKDLL